jgi:AAA+ ATPase superfamily predicted ATPase
MFVDRDKELTFLNSLLTRKYPGPAQMILMYGRRRVGKSELLLRWAEQSGVDYVYWEAVKENANQQRAHFYGKLLNVSASAAPVYPSVPREAKDFDPG